MEAAALPHAGNPIKKSTHMSNACKASAPLLGYFTNSNTARDLLKAENWTLGTNSLTCHFPRSRCCCGICTYGHRTTNCNSQRDKKSCKINSEKFYMETQQEGMLFPEMLLHQMLTISSECETMPASAAAQAQSGGEGGKKPWFPSPTKYHWGGNWKTVFGERR